jgi:hypothetical protein
VRNVLETPSSLDPVILVACDERTEALYLNKLQAKTSGS